MQHAGERSQILTFQRILKACANAGNEPKTLHFYNQMLQAGLSPDVVTLTTTIGVFIESGSVGGAKKWSHNMEAAGVKESVVAYNCVITVCGTAGSQDLRGRQMNRPYSRTFGKLVGSCSGSCRRQPEAHACGAGYSSLS